MPKVVRSHASTSAPRRRSSRIMAIVRRMPKLSAAKSRRLSALMEKRKDEGLTRKEDRELRDLLDLVDRQSYWNLAEAIEIEARSSSAPRRVRKTG
jgi:hypothetical protein